MTSARLGAHTLNYTEVVGLLHKEVDGEKVLSGARVRDKITSKYTNLYPYLAKAC